MKSNRFFSYFVVIFILFLLVGKSFAEEIHFPAPVGDIYVQDFANLLTEQERTELVNLGRLIEDKTTAQVAVLTVNSTGDRPMEEYANEALREYGIGNKEEDNGVLLVVALNDRQVRIEVGYGLEGRIPDGKAGRILDEYAIPYLKNQEPNRAIVETYKVLGNEVLEEYGQAGMQVPSEQPQNVTRSDGGGIPSWLFIIIVMVVLFLDFKFFGGFLTHLLLSIMARGGRGGGGGGFRGGGGGSSGGGGAGRGW
jgi:uncharacterized protein